MKIFKFNKQINQKKNKSLMNKNKKINLQLTNSNPLN